MRNPHVRLTRKRNRMPFPVRIDIELIEANQEKTKNPFKAFTENAGAVALTLGLLLSIISLYDVLVRKPEADRITAISQFNQTVNSAAKIRQELIQSANSSDPAIRLAVASMATPRILNDIATARALLLTLEEKDIGVPQLLILISESMTAGDTASAKEFVSRAVNRTDVTPYMKAEALRYQGKFQFVTGDPVAARSSYQQALTALGTGVQVNAVKAYTLADRIGMQLAVGACDGIEDDLSEFGVLLQSQGVSAEVRSQLVGAVNLQIEQYSGQKCPRPNIKMPSF